MTEATVAELPLEEWENDLLILQRPDSGVLDGDPIDYWRQLHEEGWSTGDIAREVGYDASTVSKVLSGKYLGDMDAVRRSFSDARRLHVGPSDGAVIRTINGALIDEALNEAEGSQWLTLIYGPPGVGKTSAIRRWVGEDRERRALRRRAIIITLDINATVGSVIQSVAESLGIPWRERISTLVSRIVERLRCDRRLLIFDEVNNLTSRRGSAPRIVNTLRQINDLTSCGIVLVGTVDLLHLLTDVRRRDEMEMLLSRVGKQVELGDVSPREIRALIAAHFGPVSQDVWEAFWRGMAECVGDVNLRRTAIWIQSAKRVMAINRARNLNPKVVRAAWKRIVTRGS